MTLAHPYCGLGHDCLAHTSEDRASAMRADQNCAACCSDVLVSQDLRKWLENDTPYSPAPEAKNLTLQRC
jgi:hypothetical protein